MARFAARASRALDDAQSIDTVLEWVDWFNHRRLMRPVGDIPPAEAEERYYAMLYQPAMATQLNANGLRRTGGGSKTVLMEHRSHYRPPLATGTCRLR